MASAWAAATVGSVDAWTVDAEASNFTVAANESRGLAGGADDRGIGDKEIVVIVVCSAVGLVACLLGAALLAGRVYWTKSRDDGAWYHGVAQRDSWDGNARAEDGPGASGTSPLKEPEGPETAAFGRLREIDEESASSAKPPVETVRVESTPGSISEDFPQQEGQPRVENERSVSQCSDHTPQTDVDESPLTGLSQSDRSLCRDNPSYRYGNQVPYMGGFYGYAVDETFGALHCARPAVSRPLQQPERPPGDYPECEEEEEEEEAEVRVEEEEEEFLAFEDEYLNDEEREPYVEGSQSP